MKTMSFYEFRSEKTVISDISQIPSTITLTKKLSKKLSAEAFKVHDIGTYLFSMNPSFPMSNQDQSKYELGLVNIGLDQLILVRIG